MQPEPYGANRSGGSRHGAPALAIQRTALTNRRLSLAVTPGSAAWPVRVFFDAFPGAIRDLVATQRGRSGRLYEEKSCLSCSEPLGFVHTA